MTDEQWARRKAENSLEARTGKIPDKTRYRIERRCSVGQAWWEPTMTVTEDLEMARESLFEYRSTAREGLEYRILRVTTIKEVVE